MGWHLLAESRVAPRRYYRIGRGPWDFVCGHCRTAFRGYHSKASGDAALALHAAECARQRWESVTGRDDNVALVSIEKATSRP